MYLDAEPIGCAQIIAYGADIFELAYVYILENFRGQGYGRDFVRFVVYNHPAQQIQALTISPKFFEALGFIRELQYPAFVDHSCPECQACTPSACTSLSFNKPHWLQKFVPLSPAYHHYHELLKKGNFLGSEFSIANELSWSYTENIYYCDIEGFLFFIIFPYGEEPNGVIFPYAELPASILDVFLARLESLGITELHYLTGLGKRRLAGYPSQYVFHFVPDRDNADYLYKVADFAAFAGSAFEKKRNRLKKFIRQFPEHQIVPYTAELDKDILGFAWRSIVHDLQIGVTSYEVLLRGLQSKLYKGFVVRIGHNIVGLLLYSELNPQAVIVHFELIDARYDGVAQLLNNTLGKALLGKYLFINREQDLGVPGLRRSKLSYNPYRILMKYTAQFKRAG